MWRVVPGSSVYFFLLERTTHALKELQGTNGQLLSFHISLLSAAIARGVASVIFLPVTVVKTRFEAMGPSRSYTSTLGALRTIARAEGASALWSGLLPTVLRDVPHSALYYAMYNYTKSLILPLRGPDSRVPIGALNFASGLISGLTATIVSHPFDVIRTRIQTQSAVPSALNPRGMIPMAIKIVRVREHHSLYNLQCHLYDTRNSSWRADDSLLLYKKNRRQEEGLRTFSRGFAPRLLRRSLSPAFTWTFYEELVQLLKR